MGILNQASDIHIVVGENIRFRVNGRLEKSQYRLEEVDLENFLKKLLDQEEIKKFQGEKSIDKSIDYGENRLRLHFFKERNNLSLALRIIAREVPRLEDLNLPENINRLKELKSGLVLISGSTGMGKTTTMASIIEGINQDQEKNIITIEDPIEYIYENKKSLVRQREVGRDVPSFQEGIKSVVRQDPDIIVLGELRDINSVRAAISLAEIGHLVMGTIHSRSAIDTISRIIDIFPREEKQEVRVQVSNSLRAVINQELVVSKNKRQPICEIIMVNPAISNIIRENKNLRLILDQMRLNAKSLGSMTKLDGIKKLLDLGSLDLEDIRDQLDQEDINKLIL